MTTLWDGHALRRSYKDGVARFNAYLEDYATLAGAMLDTYEASLDARYLEHAKAAGGRDARAVRRSRKRRFLLYLRRS